MEIRSLKFLRHTMFRAEIWVGIRTGLLSGFLCLMAVCLIGCGQGDGRRIVYVGHNQAPDHPIHAALLEFESFVEERLGDQYNVEVYPNELLGSQTDMVQLTQTGAIDLCVASNSILETFSENYTLFNMPYLFASSEAYHSAMDDDAVTGPIFGSTREAGFTAVTWLDAGARNFYTVSRPVNSPADLKGLKIRVQQSPTNVRMMSLLGGAATPMGFGDVYTALQSRVIDGAENNEMALTSNGHGDVCKYYSYDMHQMIPDILVVNNEFLEEMPEDHRQIFTEGFELVNRVEREEWEKAVEAARNKAADEQGVQFLYPATGRFQEICIPMHREFLDSHREMEPVYKKIQEYNEKFTRPDEAMMEEGRRQD